MCDCGSGSPAALQEGDGAAGAAGRSDASGSTEGSAGEGPEDPSEQVSNPERVIRFDVFRHADIKATSKRFNGRNVKELCLCQQEKKPPQQPEHVGKQLHGESTSPLTLHFLSSSPLSDDDEI